jgi:UDP-N-acetylglucosamine acyltransferase
VLIEAGALLGIATHLADGVRLGRGVITHDLVSVGSLASCVDGTHLMHDAPPYLSFEGSPARARGVDFASLQEADFPGYVCDALYEAHRLVYQLKVGIDRVREMLRHKGQLYPAVNHLLTFLQLQQEGRHGRSRQQPRKFAA